MKSLFAGKRILVTGGTGSIGRTIVQKILEFDPKVVRILDVDETIQYEMERKLSDFPNVRFLIGNIRDKERLRFAIEDIDIVFHLASLKHVYACEYNPFEAVKTNVVGTQNLIDVALDEEVEKVIFTSSDKAVNPCNVMGATKLLAERLITAANYYKGSRRTILSSVRFGNVLGSRGSVVSLFANQIKNGGPITVTNPEMTRFVMLPLEAIDLLMKATQMAIGGEIFIFKMRSIKIIDLVNVLIEEGSKFVSDKVKVIFIGKYPGEKIFEELMTESEAKHSLELENMFVVLPEMMSDLSKYSYPNIKPASMKSYRSLDEKLLSKKEIVEMLRRGNLLRSILNKD